MQLICESVETLQAASDPPDVLAALTWAMGQPQRRAHPRQLFLLTAASPLAAATHQSLELMRWHRGAARYWLSQVPETDPRPQEAPEGHSRFPSLIRCFSFGLGPACHRLLQGLSALSRGRAYFPRPGERLQPMVSSSLGPIPYSQKSHAGVNPNPATEPSQTVGSPGTLDQDFSSPILVPPSPLRCQSGKELLGLLWGAAEGQRCGGRGPLPPKSYLFSPGTERHILDKSFLIPRLG